MSKYKARINQVLAVIDGYDFHTADEKELQLLMAQVFDDEGIAYQREYDLGAHGIVDFYIDGIGFELKVKGQKSAVYRQCRRYCEHEEIHALVLVTSMPMGLPPMIEDKFCCVYTLRG
jgi:hypothetical protein